MNILIQKVFFVSLIKRAELACNLFTFSADDVHLIDRLNDAGRLMCWMLYQQPWTCVFSRLCEWRVETNWIYITRNWKRLNKLTQKNFSCDNGLLLCFVLWIRDDVARHLLGKDGPTHRVVIIASISRWGTSTRKIGDQDKVREIFTWAVTNLNKWIFGETWLNNVKGFNRLQNFEFFCEFMKKNALKLSFVIAI